MDKFDRTPPLQHIFLPRRTFIVLSLFSLPTKPNTTPYGVIRYTFTLMLMWKELTAC